jgi:hypothetical protein
MFRRRRASLAQLSYDTAYRILPHYAYNNLSKLIEMAESAATGGSFAYALACAFHKQDTEAEEARLFRWHSGTLDEGLQYWVLEYPVPSPLDLSHVDPEEIAAGRGTAVLAPHFSAAVREADGCVSYWILGQAPIGGGTTLRAVASDGTNANLGPGPQRDMRTFLATVQHALSLGR